MAAAALSSSSGDDDEETSSDASAADSDELAEECKEDASGSATNKTKLFMWYFDQCDPKKCSGMALKRLGKLRTIKLKSKFNGIVLTPAT